MQEDAFRVSCRASRDSNLRHQIGSKRSNYFLSALDIHYIHLMQPSSTLQISQMPNMAAYPSQRLLFLSPWWIGNKALESLDWLCLLLHATYKTKLVSSNICPTLPIVVHFYWWLKLESIQTNDGQHVLQQTGEEKWQRYWKEDSICFHPKVRRNEPGLGLESPGQILGLQ